MPGNPGKSRAWAESRHTGDESLRQSPRRMSSFKQVGFVRLWPVFPGCNRNIYEQAVVKTGTGFFCRNSKHLFGITGSSDAINLRTGIDGGRYDWYDAPPEFTRDPVSTP